MSEKNTFSFYESSNQIEGVRKKSDIVPMKKEFYDFCFLYFEKEEKRNSVIRRFESMKSLQASDDLTFGYKDEKFTLMASMIFSLTIFNVLKLKYKSSVAVYLIRIMLEKEGVNQSFLDSIYFQKTLDSKYSKYKSLIYAGIKNFNVLYDLKIINDNDFEDFKQLIYKEADPIYLAFEKSKLISD